MEPFHYWCPFCQRDTTISKERCSSVTNFFTIDNADGARALSSLFVVCPNTECRKAQLNVSLAKADPNPFTNVWERGKLLKSWRLVPEAAGKTFPDFIPPVLRADYAEACAILTLSPKASATLSRRCLQGMIRDFHGIAKATLKLEIDALKEKIETALWEAIDAVRKVGNIGAHMEKDINFIVDVDEGEAEALRGLVELLFEEWYVARDERARRLAGVKAIGDAKDAAKAAAKSTS